MGVVGAVKEFFAKRGFTLMIFGISAAAAGVLLYALLNTARYAATVYPRIAVGLAVLGFAAYFIGRVSVAIQRGKNKRSTMESIAARNDEDGE